MEKDDDSVAPTTDSDPAFGRISSEFNTLNLSTPLDTNDEDDGFLPANDVLEESIWDDNSHALNGTGINQASTVSTNERVVNQNDPEHLDQEETDNDLFDWTSKIRKTYRPLDADIIVC